MALFSERLGYSPKRELQVESMDEGLRNRLWSVIKFYLLGTYYSYNSTGYRFLEDELWDRFYKQSEDDLPRDIDEQMNHVKASFRRCSWHRAFDMLEFIAQNYPDCVHAERSDYRFATQNSFIEAVNVILEEEHSGYRFVGTAISPITSSEEVMEVGSALDSPGPSANHLQKALDHLSNRKQPDYRNSVKESISAVESMANLITGVKNPSLGQALPEVEKRLGLKLHGAKRKALQSLYGWASDEARHGLLEESHLTQEDARFALIVCSAFVNYLKAKAVNAGVSLESNVQVNGDSSPTGNSAP